MRPSPLMSQELTTLLVISQWPGSVFMKVVWVVDIRLGIRACKLGDNLVKVSEWTKTFAFLILSVVHWKQKQALERWYEELCYLEDRSPIPRIHVA